MWVVATPWRSHSASSSASASAMVVARRSGVSQQRPPDTRAHTSNQLSPCWLKPWRQVTHSIWPTMADPKPTQAFAATFVDELARCGLNAVCVAPGSRSAPLAMAFARHPAIRVWMHLDERSASFFALGMAKATERPVALLCTSGTAAAEFHPAVVEAHHSRAPLLVLTADRPPELRDVGANQAIDQARLYGGAVRWCFDPGVPDAEPGAPARWRRLAARALAEASGPPAGPVHLNLPLREPLTPAPGQVPVACAAAPL